MTHTNRLFKRFAAATLTLALLVSCCAFNAVSVSADSTLPLPYADVNADGAANIKDVNLLFRAVASGDQSSLTDETALCADVDGNGELSMKDVQKLYQAISGNATLESVAPAPSEYELEVFRLVNIEREKAGVAPLTYNYDCQLFSDIRANECTYYFDHTRPNGESCFDLFFDYENPYIPGGENIAIFQRSPQQVVTDWMNSPGHRANILNRSFKTLTVGCQEIPDYPGYYSWTQFFTY